MPDKLSYDPNWINFEYLEANRVNINFKRDKEQKTSLPLEELSSLEEDLYYDKHLTWQEKSVLLKEKVNNNLPEPCCKFCLKTYKAIGKCLFKHESICFFNPEVAKNLKLSTFKMKVLN